MTICVMVPHEAGHRRKQKTATGVGIRGRFLLSILHKDYYKKTILLNNSKLCFSLRARGVFCQIVISNSLSWKLANNFTDFSISVNFLVVSKTVSGCIPTVSAISCMVYPARYMEKIFALRSCPAIEPFVFCAQTSLSFQLSQ